MLTALLRVLSSAPSVISCRCTPAHLVVPHDDVLFARSSLMLTDGWRGQKVHAQPPSTRFFFCMASLCLWGSGILPLDCISMLSCVYFLMFTKARHVAKLSTLIAYCLSPVWVLWWTMSFCFVVKAFPQSLHSKGFLSCVNSLMFNETWLLGTGFSTLTTHSKGVFPVWNLWWAMRQVFSDEAFPHSLHVRFLTCELMYNEISLLDEAFPQSLQIYPLSLGVGFLMYIEPWFLSEGFATVSALVRFLPCAFSDVQWAWIF